MRIASSWALVLLSVLSAGAANAQGFPLKPKFQDVRIGYSTLAQCEAAFTGPGSCDLTAQQGIYSAIGFVTDGRVGANEAGFVNLGVSGGDIDLFADTSNFQIENASGGIGIMSETHGVFVGATVGDITALAGGLVSIESDSSSVLLTAQTTLGATAGATINLVTSTGDITLDAGDELIATPENQFRVNVGAGADELEIDADQINIAAATNVASVLTVGTVPVATMEGGSFSAVFTTACTTDYTVVYDWQRVGQIVTVRPVTVPSPCTGDSTSFLTTAAPIPAAIRPATDSASPMWGNFLNAGASTNGSVSFRADGNVVYFQCGASGCVSTNWTASGNRQGGVHDFTYMLGNP